MGLRLRRAADQFPEARWPVSEGHLVVLYGDRVIGTLRCIDGGPQQGSWFWSITGCYVPPGTMTLSGTAESKEEAKVAFGKTLRKWMAWAGLDEETS